MTHSEATQADTDRYRPEIDGLRALAILGVLLFHIDAWMLPGGFLGVDIFFVISGYLISGNISRALVGGHWSFSHFYANRLLRLFPALAVTTILTFAAAAFILTPNHFREFAESAASTVFWFSNVQFWTEAGYFDTSALFKPLLHTWSLSVEEQFYLIWPLLLWAGFGRWANKGLIWVVALAFFVSLASALMLHDKQPDAVFYLTPFRMFEFAVGTLAYQLRGWRPGPLLADLAAAIGIALIAASYDLFVARKAAVPGLWSLVPCLGAALIVHSADRGRWMQRLLALPLLVWLGRISYSLYLAHWPVVVLGSYVLVFEPTLPQKALFGAVSLLLGTLLYYGIERPFQRLRKSRSWSIRSTVVRSTMVAGTVALAGLVVSLYGGLDWRYPAEMQQVAAFNVEEARRATWQDVNQFNTGNFGDETIDILVVGDSHAKDFYNAIVLNKDLLEAQYGPLNVAAFITNQHCERGGHPDQLCNLGYAPLFEQGLHLQSRIIVFNQAWNSREIDALPQVVQRLRQGSDADIAVMEESVRLADVPSTVLRGYRWGDPNSWMSDHQNQAYVQNNVRLAHQLDGTGVSPFPMDSIMCPDQRCSIIDDDGHLYLYDEAHWTLDGAKEFGRRMIDAGYFAQMFAAAPERP